MTKTFISLFGGIGGFDLALQKKKWTCVYYNDWDKYAVQTYNKNFGAHYEPTDIKRVDIGNIPDHDLLTAGFPCQSFSIAGQRRGFEDTRGTCFFEICKIAERKRTLYLLLENVKGLLSHDEGRTFATILRSLDELGYDAQWQVLNSRYFGVPQNRERVFIIANLRSKPRPQIFPLSPSPRGCSAEDASTTIDSNYWKGVDNHGQRTMIIHNIYGGFNEDEVREFDQYSPTIRTAQGGGHIPFVLENNKVRKLTPIGCERLQGFPDNWTAGVSDTQRYRQCGNAVTVNVIQAIIEKLDEELQCNQ